MIHRVQWYVGRFLIGTATMIVIAIAMLAFFMPFMTCFDLTGKCADGAVTDSKFLPDYITVSLLLLLVPCLGESTIQMIKDF